MKRREVIKMSPFSVACAAGFSEVDHTAAKNTTSPASYPKIKEHNGTPTLFLDEQPVHYTGTWLFETWEFKPSSQNLGEDTIVRLMANTDSHIYAFNAGTAGSAPQWCGPKKGSVGTYDFSEVKPTFERIIDIDPYARFHLRVKLEMLSDWWSKTYPEESEVTSLGLQPRQSYASEVWHKQANDFLKAFIAHIKSIDMLDRVLAIQVGCGHTGEWGKPSSSMATPCGDYSEPMRRYFRAYLSKKYNNDIIELRNAWNNPEITFETAAVPLAGEQLHAKNYIFRDPSSEQNVIDYFRCLAELCSDLLIDYCRTVKEETDGKLLAGAFYGYLMELSWNAGFFAEWPDRWWESDYSTTQRSGHLGLNKVLDSPYIDFLVSPHSYGFRGIGGDAPSMIPVETARIHGKFIIVEDDVRFHKDTYHGLYGQAKNLQESITILQRNFNHYVTHGEGYWRTVIDDKRLLPVLKQLNELGTFALQTDRAPISEIAVLLDDESFYYETVKNNLDVPLIFRQKLEGLARMGAPFGTYLLDDFVEGRVRQHKLYIFLNCFRLDNARREKLKHELRRDGNVAVWLYAPGYVNNDLSIENMTDLTGFKFAMSRQPWGATMHIVNFKHPVTAGIPQDLFWGTNSLLSPVFYLEDPDALELAQVIHAQGRCVPGMGIKVFPDWTSVFVSAPNIPAPVLRGLACFSKVHLYNNEGDVLNVTKHLLGVHTVSGGTRTFNLPHKVQEIYDLFNNISIAHNSDQFQIQLPPISTSLFYTGDSSLLSNLKGI